MHKLSCFALYLHCILKSVTSCKIQQNLTFEAEQKKTEEKASNQITSNYFCAWPWRRERWWRDRRRWSVGRWTVAVPSSPSAPKKHRCKHVTTWRQTTSVTTNVSSDPVTSKTPTNTRVNYSVYVNIYSSITGLVYIFFSCFKKWICYDMKTSHFLLLYWTLWIIFFKKLA